MNSKSRMLCVHLVEMASVDSRSELDQELDEMLAGFERQAKFSLRRIDRRLALLWMKNSGNIFCKSQMEGTESL